MELLITLNKYSARFVGVTIKRLKIHYSAVVNVMVQLDTFTTIA